MKSSHLKGYLLVAASSILFGFNVVFARVIGLPSPILLFYRYVFAAFTLGIFLFVRRGKINFPKTQKGNILLLGLFNTLTALLAFYAFVYTTIANAEILLYASPIYILVLAPIFLKEKIEKTTLISLILSFVGIILIATSGHSASSSNNLGIISGFLAGIAFSLFYIVSKKMSSSYDGLDLNFYMIALSIIFLTPFLFFVPYELNWYKLILLFIMGIQGGALALSLYFQGLKTVKAQHLGILSYLEPLSAVVYAMFIFGEIPGLTTLIGGFLILFSGYRILREQK